MTALTVRVSYWRQIISYIPEKVFGFKLRDAVEAGDSDELGMGIGNVTYFGCV